MHRGSWCISAWEWLISSEEVRDCLSPPRHYHSLRLPFIFFPSVTFISLSIYYFLLLLLYLWR